MKKILNVIVCLSMAAFIMQSCVDKDFDDINKNIEFNVPPIPLGSLDTIYVGNLPYIPVEINYTVADTIKGLFDEDTNKRFFYDGADDVELVGNMDIVLGEPSMQSTTLTISVNIIDLIDGQYVENQAKVTIAPVTFTPKINQPFTIKIAADQMQYMKYANGLRFKVNFNLPTVNLKNTDYLLLKDVVIKTGGISLDL